MQQVHEASHRSPTPSAGAILWVVTLVPSVDYGLERLPSSSEALIYVAMMRLMVRRLVEYAFVLSISKYPLKPATAEAEQLQLPLYFLGKKPTLPLAWVLMLATEFLPGVAQGKCTTFR